MYSDNEEGNTELDNLLGWLSDPVRIVLILYLGRCNIAFRSKLDVLWNHYPELNSLNHDS